MLYQIITTNRLVLSVPFLILSFLFLDTFLIPTTVRKEIVTEVSQYFSPSKFRATFNYLITTNYKTYEVSGYESLLFHEGSTINVHRSALSGAAQTMVIGNGNEALSVPVGFLKTGISLFLVIITFLAVLVAMIWVDKIKSKYTRLNVMQLLFASPFVFLLLYFHVHFFVGG
jgi:hypothetical protein